MKQIATYLSEDGRKFETKAECEAYELRQGYAGPIAEYLDSLEFDSDRARAIRRNAIAGFLRWQRSSERDPLGDALNSGDGTYRP